MRYYHYEEPVAKAAVASCSGVIPGCEAEKGAYGKESLPRKKGFSAIWKKQVDTGEHPPTARC